MTTPLQKGFRMPAEYERHAGCWMVWPEGAHKWRDDARPAQLEYTNVAKAISQFERVTVGASPQQYDLARKQLPSDIEVVKIVNDDAWVRDSGPTFLVNEKSELAAVSFDFNAWGGLCPCENDKLVGGKIAEFEKAQPVFRPGFVLEGGSIHSDGQGTILTTEQCLLNPNRNPTLNKQQIEDLLENNLGATKVIWLGHGVYEDETSGHVDNLCCFARTGEVILTWCDEASDPMYEICRDAERRLLQATDARGNRLVIHKILQPNPPLFRTQSDAVSSGGENTYDRGVGTRLAASYVNFLIVNGGIIAPQFGAEPSDAEALTRLREIFPDRKVVGVGSRDILLGGGNIHCITQQVPHSNGK